MNKMDLIKAVSEQSGFSQKDTAVFIDSFVDVLKEAVTQGEKVKIVDFGTFYKKVRSSKIGVNPKKPNEKIEIPEKVVPMFTPGKDFKEKVNQK